jgi:tetratricopeptide (TPR) repeat protein
MLLVLATGGCRLPHVSILSDPLTSEEHLDLGLTYRKQNRFELAREHYTAAMEQGNPEAALYIANSYYLEGNKEAAEAWYRKAIHQNPENSNAHNNLAWLFLSENRNLVEAKRLAEKAVELDPDNLSAVDTLEAVNNALARETKSPSPNDR